MGQRSYPPLKPGEIEAILKNLKFALKRKEGSHEQWYRAADGTRKAAIVTLDRAYAEIGDPKLIQSMIRQSGFTKEEFYGATKKTARKASVKFWLSSTLEAE